MSEQTLNNRLRGIHVPFPTPFGADGEVDARAVRENIARWNETGISGYVALGSTGERVHLDERERLTVVEAAREVVSKSMAFIVGIGEQDTRRTIRDAALAARAGADAVLVMTPHFYRGRMTPAALVKHFTSVADASPVPIILYNIPQNTGVALTPETIARLGEHENICGIKDSSGDVATLMETLHLAGGAPERFRIMTGHAGVLYPSLCAGVSGAVLAAACVVPQLCVEVFEAVAA
ncbi:MAG: dihydrodipicolinate synthase family protein, partial [Pyrinomonadaceae bacterium]